MDLNKKDKSKYSNQQFKFICELLWGGVPTNRYQAEESALFKSEAPKILAEYPMLDKSFFEKHKEDINRKEK
jgi:hypothetical protein